MSGGSVWAFAAAWTLALVFVWSALAKIGRPAETAEGFTELGLRDPATMAKVVPVVEVGAALLLLVARPVGAVLSFGLLVAFSVVLARVLRSGLHVRCACFGAVSSREVSPRDLLRNAALMALALVAFLA